MSTMIYKILRTSEWAALQADGHTPGAPVDVQDGYVHFSTAEQLAETLARHFAAEDGLYLLAVDGTPLGADLRWEVSRGGAPFPHLYRELRVSDVQWAKPLEVVNGVHHIPSAVD